MSNKNNLIIYRNRLLPKSETFVKGQAEALRKFTPYYLGSRIVQGLQLPGERTLVVNRGGLLGRRNEISSKLWGFATTFVEQVRNLNPALIHAHFGQDGAMALPLAKDLQVPLLVTFHGFDITVRDEHAERSLVQRVYFRRREALKRETQLFIAVSEFIKNKLLEQGFPCDKIVVHYIGIDTKQFQPDSAVPREPVVLFVGRLVEKKGCEYLIQAMSRVQAAMPEVELVVIGDGLLRSSLEQRAKAKLRRYRFLGVQPPEIVQSWMNQAKVFCVPSITAKSGDSEGFGLVFAEAQAMGLPVVSFASGGIPEAVAHGETGFLVAERDCDGLTTYILRLLQDKALWQQFSQSGQERVRTKFDLHNQTRLLESIYEDRVLQNN
jgi:glycosyltransferase involved in cell wall biosynthesis